VAKLKEYLSYYNDIISRCEIMAIITRDSNLQRSAVEELSQLITDIQTLKELAIRENDENEANGFFSLACAATSLQFAIKMWLLLKQDKPDEAWDALIDAQAAAVGALKAHSVSSHLEGFCELLHTVERIIFPSQVFASSGFTVIDEECSICGGDYEDCEHISGKPYMGKFCYIIVKKAKLNEVSIVEEPADKKCRITHFDDGGGSRNRMTWKVEQKDHP
jgi:hypothetical protein